jgi:SAM-dependent methyltransferase
VSDVDFGKTAADYARHRAGFPPALPERLAAMGVLRAGLRALDLGTGTGTLARWLARAGCAVVGLDPAVPMLRQAQALDREEALRIGYVAARAERVPLPDASLDLVTAGQCWHWFDRTRVAAEARRLLRPGGALVIAHYDWVPLPGNVVEATERLVLEHNARWTGAGTTGLYPAWLADVALAGFERLETFSTDVPATYTHEGWRGRIRACAGVGASLAPDAVARFDAALAALLRARFPAESLEVPHRVFAVVSRSPA